MLCNLVEIDVGKVHHEVLSHEALQLLGLYDIKLGVILEAAHELMEGGLIIVPVLLVCLHL